MVNCKTTAVRLLPAPGKTVGDTIEMAAWLGSAPGDAGASGVQRGIHRPGRTNPRSDAQSQKLEKKRTGILPSAFLM